MKIRLLSMLSIILSSSVKLIFCFRDFSETGNFGAYVNALHDGVNYLKDTIFAGNDSSKASNHASRWAVTVIYINVFYIVNSQIVLPEGMKATLQLILGQTIQLMSLYRAQIYDEMVPGVDENTIRVISLIGLEEEWRMSLESFKGLQQEPIILTNVFQSQFPLLSGYVSSHDIIQHEEQKLFQPCFQDLVNNVISEHHCSLDLRCLSMISNRKFNYGLSLMAWLHFFTNLKFTRHCYAFTKIKDASVVHDLCSLALNENIYLVSHKYAFMEEILERITLCTLLDHVQFLNASWINTALSLATPRGCFRTKPFFVKDYTRRRNLLNYALQENCDLKATYLSVAYMSLIVQNFSKNYDNDDVKYYSTKMDNAIDYIRKTETHLNFTSALHTFLTMEISLMLQVDEILNSNLRSDINDIYTKVKEHVSDAQSNRTEEISLTLQVDKMLNSTLRSDFSDIYIKEKEHLPNQQINRTEESECLMTLMNNPSEQREYHKCNLSANCIKLITQPYDYENRAPSLKSLFILTVARYTKSCFILSPIQDKAMIDDICSAVYEHIPIMDNTNVIEMLQLSFYCGINGHSGFLEKSWHAVVLSKQQPNGCFPNKKIKLGVSRQSTRRDAQNCSPHATLFSLTSLALSVRYIAEVFYG